MGLLVKEPFFGQDFKLSPGKELSLFEGQCHTSPCKLPCLTGVGQEAELADLTKARGQEVQAKPMEELDAGQHHFLSFGAVCIVLVGEPNMVLVNIKDTPIGNGHAV